MLIKCTKNSAKAVFNNINIVLYPVIFLIVLNFLLACSVTAISSITTFIVTTCIFLLTAGFLAGWFSVIKNSLDIEKIKDNKYFSIFLEGTGKNMLPITLGLAIYFALLIIVMFITSKIALLLFGSLDSIIKDISLLPKENSAYIEYLKNLSLDDSYKIYSWQLSFIIASGIFNFLFMFYFPALSNITKEKIYLTPFKAIKNAVSFTFKNFLPNLGLYFSIYLIYFLIVILNALFGNRAIISGILFFIYIYFITFSVVLIFNYYEWKNNSSNGCYSLRENESSDSAG